MNKQRSLSQFRIALQTFRENRLGMFCVTVLSLLYFTAIFADFLSPYRYDREERNYSYAPPTKIHFIDEGRLSWPFIYGIDFEFNEFHKRIYREERSETYPLRFFIRGDEYRFLGFWKTDVHLVGVEEPGRGFFLGGDLGGRYFLGADSRGRDLWTRLLYGGRVSLSIGLIGVFISFSIGLLIGGAAGYYGGATDNILMRICEMFMMVPGFYLMLALRSAVPDTFNSLQVYFSVVIILSFIGWAGLARIIRGMSISLRERDYVAAARTMGLSDFHIIVRHILPHTLSYSIVAIMLGIPGYILGEAALSLIGLGIQDPLPSWGNLLSEAMGIVYINFAPWILWPGFFIFLTVICFNVIGDILRDSLDPMLKGELNQ